MHRSVCIIITWLTLVSAGDLQAGWEKLFDKGPVQCFLSLGDVLLVGSYTGCYRSPDLGKSWTFIPVDSIITPSQGTIYAGVNSLSGNGRYIFAATNLSMYASGDSGRTWMPLGPTPGGKFLLFIKTYANMEMVLATMAGGGLFRSTDNGMSWTYLGAHRQFDYIEHGDALFAGAMDGIWCSTDRGITWTQCAGFPFYKQVAHLAHNDKVIFADAYDNLYRSDDNGVTWNIHNDGLPIDHHLEGVFVTGTYVFAGLSEHRVYLSSDNGGHWSNISAGLDTIDQEGPYGQFGRSDDRVYSNKNGCLWSYDVSRLSLSIGEPAASVRHFALGLNYPNPFNPATHFQFSIGNFQLVILKVYDVLGREVATVVSEELPAGSYVRQWNAGALTSGVYYYRLQAGPLSETRKLILLQ